MAHGRFVSYLRVSTDRQGRSGLGLEAQRKAVNDYLNGGRWRVIAELVEIESGRRSDRPALAEALAACRVHRAPLVVAKVDRLTRSAAFLNRLLEAGVDVRFCDLPQIEGPTGIFMLQQMVSVAQLEAGLIGKRTKDALAAAKARGQKLGGVRSGQRLESETSALGRAIQIDRANARASDLKPVIEDLRRAGALTNTALAAGLNERGIPTARGVGKWSPVQVSRVLARLDAASIP